MREYLVCTMREYTLPIRVAVVLSVLQLVHASWWYLGVASSYQPIVDELNHSPMGSPRGQAAMVRGGMNRQLLECSDLQFMGPRQRELCALDKSLIHVISEGASMGIEECQHQFQDRRWNCSTFNTTSVFGNILNIQSRETAYIYAISSAGIMYAVTRACSKGELMNCGCDRRVRRRYKTDGTFEWGGCSDNIRYGARFAQEFVDSNERRIDAQGLMNLWNNGAGRKTAKDSLDIKCKCHGVSGSCSVKICWRKLKPFRAIGAELKDKFDGASHVRLDTKRKRLKRVTNNQKRPRKNDLVYLRESPDFCEYNPQSGSLGTRGRRCNKTSYGLDGCTLMCCGRGYYTLIKEEKDDCDCKFYWCCRVECKQCTHLREMNYCN
ncbi:protein Wnt-4-like isoform X2 [Littorina saxatilis]|uniref:protein Wnt-4-like isoform X2 n=1 Tax=Littorina saxatilis TaxID=31220 RepID=UPI0038B64FBA